MTDQTQKKTRYSVTVNTSHEEWSRVLCDEVDLDEQAGTLTVYGYKALSGEWMHHRVYMLRNVLYYTVQHVEVDA